MVVRLFNGIMQVVERVEFTDCNDADFKGEIDKPVATVIAGTGAADSGKIIKLDANGKVDPSLIPAAATLPGDFGVLNNTAGPVDLTATGVTALWTVTAGNNVVVTHLVFRIITIAAITAHPTLGVGVAAGESDILFPSPLFGIQNGLAGSPFLLPLSGLQVAIAATNVINLGVDTAAVGTTLDVTIDLIGYRVT